MKNIIKSMVVLAICIILQSCNQGMKPLNIQIPKGLRAVTVQQKQLLENIKTLKKGMSISDVKNILGSPEEESKKFLFYNYVESKLNGGYYVTAHLKFDDMGLASGEVGFGRISLEPVR